MNTIIDVLKMRAAETPDRTAFLFLDAEGEESGRLSFADLGARARAVAGRLAEQGVGAGDRVLLLYPPSLDYISSFFGCLCAGAVAVPAYPPRPRGPTTRIESITRDARPRAALTIDPILAGARAAFGTGSDSPVSSWISTDEGLVDAPDFVEPPEASSADALAFLQYTSGSTSTPKGVMVSHGNLMANERMIQNAFAFDRETTFVGWLPMFHDMGLIGHIIQPLFLGSTAVVMSPITFVQKPIRWLRAMSKYQGRAGGGPNFAYDMCVAKTTPEEREGLDLSTWELAFNGAEPVRPDSMERFVRTFEPYGFEPAAIQPVYGLAEATLFVTGTPEPRRARYADLDRAALAEGRAVEAVDGQRFASCGVGQGQEVAIVDRESSSRLPEGSIGEIWIQGPNVAEGYWGRPELSESEFRAVLRGEDGHWLRTGDLGFLLDGELYVSGRSKDLIIVRGRNHFPQDIELTAERSHADLRIGCSAAFSIDDGGEERVAIVVEVRRQAISGDLEAVADAIRRAVLENHELSTHTIVLIKPGSISKTSSGKIQRSKMRARLESGALDTLFESSLDPEVQPTANERPEQSLLRRTLTALGPEGGRGLLESHLREQHSALAASPDVVRQALERELGVGIAPEVFAAVEDFDGIAGRVIELIQEQGD